MQSVTITAPDIEPLPFGLTSVAVPTDVPDVHQLAGIDYEVQCGHVPGFVVQPCTGLSGTSTVGTAGNYPGSLTIVSDIPGDYVITWTNGSPATNTVTFVAGDTTKTTAHTFTTTGAKTVTVVGPLGFGTQTIVLNPGTLANDVAGASFAKPAVPALTTVVGDPVTLHARYECTPVGVNQADRDARAMDGLMRSESYALEAALYSRVLSGAGVLDLTAGVATTPLRAIALLENYAGRNYAGRPVIHVDRFVGSLLTSTHTIERHGNRLETVQGALVASGAGYGQENVPTTEWAYVTGQVVIVRGKAISHADITRSTNVAMSMAERPYVFAVECIVAKAKVAVT